MKYREAIFQARSGATVTHASKIVRFLTKEEAAIVFLERMPEKRPRRDEEEQIMYDKDGMIVDVVAPDADPRILGLFDVSVTPPVEFRPTEEDMASTEWREHDDGVP